MKDKLLKYFSQIHKANIPLSPTQLSLGIVCQGMMVDLEAWQTSKLQNRRPLFVI
jgi:hypothetical protein